MSAPGGELWVVRPGPTGGPPGHDPGRDTVVFDGDLRALHLELALRDPVALLVDAARRGGLVGRLTTLVHHVAPGGRYVVLLPGAASPHAQARERLLDLVARVVALRDSGDLAPTRVEATDVRPREVRDLHALAASVTGVEVTTWQGHDAVVLEVAGPPRLAVVPEADWAVLLRRRPDLGGTLLEVAGAPAPHRGSFESSDPGEEPFSGTAPTLSLRSFPEARVAPRQLAVDGRRVLPATFRDPLKSRLRTRWLVDWAPHAALVPDGLGDEGLPGLPRLAGPHLHLDNVERGHFGHAMTEQLSTTWAWEQARRLRPGVRALVGAHPDRPVADWELGLLEAAGVPRGDVVVATGPVVVEELLTATPAYAIGRYVHPSLVDHWDVVGARLEAAAAPGPRPGRVFLTRPPGKRSCTDADAVEDLAVRHGFTLLRPETLGLAEQVAVVRAASAVAGYAGSGTFHLALAPRGVPVVVVAPTAYHAANERQIAAARGHHLHVLRGASRPVDTPRHDEAMHADYTVGTAGLAWLESRLAALPG